MANIQRFLFFILLSLPGMMAHAQDSEIRLINSNPDFHHTEVFFQLGEYQLIPIETANGIEQLIDLKGSAPMLQKGAPELPRITSSIQIPDALEMEIEVVSDNYIDIPNVTIAASLGNFYRNEPLQNRNRTYSENFNSSDLFPASIANLSQPYIYKNVRGQTLVFYPFQYNRETKILRVHQQIHVSIQANNRPSIINCFPPNLIKSNTKKDEAILKQHFINYSITRSTESTSDERLLLITTALFKPELTSFISWKRKCGFDVEVQTIEQIGNADQLKQFISTRYLNQPFSNLILIGDDAQIPSLMRFGGASDPSFGYVLGDDYYPEISVGRISAETIPELRTQLNRILAYDKAEGMNHFDRFIGIASALGPGDNNEYDFQHIRGIGNQLAQSGYAHVDELFEGSQGGADLNGNPNAAELVNAFNSGSGLIMYAGHGVQSKFTTTNFGSDDVNSLNNINQLPFVVSVACLNGDFIQGTCLGESFMRAENNAQAVGAVGVYMSSINQSWNPPMSAQDEMSAIISANDLTITDFSLGNICELACVKMIDDYGDAGAEMASTWHLFGDPSLKLRTRQPQTLSVAFPESIQINSTSIEVECEVENAVISVLQNGNLIGGASISGGLASVSIERLLSLDSLEIVVSAFNFLPFFGQIDVLPSNDAFITVRNSHFNDSLGNNNLQLDYSEVVYLEFELSNFGLMTSDSIQTQVICLNDNIELSNFTCYFDSLAAFDNIQSVGCIEFFVNSYVEDLNPVQFEILISVGNNQSFSTFLNAEILAPKLVVNSFQIEELSGNFNGRADPGETLLLKLTNNNIGHAISPHGTASIACSNYEINFDNQTSSVDSIEMNGSSISVFQIDIPSEIHFGTNLAFDYQLICGNYLVNQAIVLKVGAQIEDAESSNFTSYPWNNSNSNPWLVDNTSSFAGNSSFKSATILGGNSSELSIQLSVPESDSVRFYFKVSSELTWDLLSFSMDDNELHVWSGDIDWKQVSFPISAGAHELKWKYSKDNVVSAGLDAAWIDDIEFPVGTSFPTSLNTLVNHDILIYPNPTNGQFRLSQTDDLFPAEINLYSIQGKLLIEDLFINNGLIVLPKNMSSGVYLLQINERFCKFIYSNN